MVDKIHIIVYQMFSKKIGVTIMTPLDLLLCEPSHCQNNSTEYQRAAIKGESQYTTAAAQCSYGNIEQHYNWSSICLLYITRTQRVGVSSPGVTTVIYLHRGWALFLIVHIITTNRKENGEGGP